MVNLSIKSEEQVIKDRYKEHEELTKAVTHLIEQASNRDIVDKACVVSGSFGETRPIRVLQELKIQVDRGEVVIHYKDKLVFAYQDSKIVAYRPDVLEWEKTLDALYDGAKDAEKEKRERYEKEVRSRFLTSWGIEVKDIAAIPIEVPCYIERETGDPKPLEPLSPAKLKFTNAL